MTWPSLIRIFNDCNYTLLGLKKCRKTNDFNIGSQICSSIGSYSVPKASDCSDDPSSNGTFMYFAYGSNLLSKRILLQNPTAIRKGIGNAYSPQWNGSIATVVEDTGRDVWGVIWEIDISNLEDLDRQEAVHLNIYKAIMLDVETSTNDPITCRVYLLVENPVDPKRVEDLPFDRRPSWSYLNCIMKGAVESDLPITYIEGLKRIPNNNQEANNPELKDIIC